MIDRGTTPKSSRRTLLKGAAGAAAGVAALGVSKRSRAVDAPAFVRQTGSAVEVLFWSSWGTGTPIGEAEQEVIRRFNESQQDVVIRHEFQGTYDETAQKLTAALQARQAPALSVLSEANWFRFYTSQFLAPMDEFIAANEVDTADYVESFFNEGKRNDQHWWMSFARSTPLFYYNKQAWQEAGLPDRGPETYTEFSQWGPKLVKRSGNEVSRWGFSHPPASDFISWYFQGTIWAFGGAYSDDQFTPQLTNENGIRAGEWLRSTVTDGWAAPTSQDRIQDFLNGTVASIMQSTAQVARISEEATFEFGTGFLPSEVNAGCPTGGAGLAILATAPPEQQEAAFKYIAFATSPEITTFWSQNTGYMPVRKSAISGAEMQEYYKTNPNFQTAVQQLETTQPQDPARVAIPGGDRIIGDGLERITVNQAEVQSTFEDIQSQLEEEAQPVLDALSQIEG